MKKWLTGLYADLGTLRAMLLFGAVLLTIFMPAPGTLPDLASWQIISTLLIPTLSPLFFMVILFDALMAKVLMSDVKPIKRRQLRKVLIINLIIATAMLIPWVPYFMMMGKP